MADDHFDILLKFSEKINLVVVKIFWFNYLAYHEAETYCHLETDILIHLML